MGGKVHHADLMQSEESLDGISAGPLTALQEVLQLVHGSHLGEEVAALRGEEDEPPCRLGMLCDYHRGEGGR